MDKLQDLKRDIRLSMKLIRSLDSQYVSQSDELRNLISKIQASEDLKSQQADRGQLVKLMKAMYFERVNSLAEANYAYRQIENVHKDLTYDYENLKKFYEQNHSALPDDDQSTLDVHPHQHPKVLTQEPRYCMCNDVYYGEMIACDNADCPVEWYHLECVGLKKAPKGRWFCPRCK